MMDHPGSLIGPHHGDMAIYPPVLLVGEMSRNLGVLLVELPVGLLEIVSMGLNETVLGGVNESAVKKEFPQGVRIHDTGDICMGVRCIGENMS